MARSGFTNSAFVRQQKKIPPRVYVPVLFGLFSMVMALSAALFLRQGKASAEAAIVRNPVTVVINQPIARVEVIVPKIEILTGSVLSADMFRTVSLPESQVNRAAIRSYSEIDGFYAKTLLVPEQPLTRDFLTPIKPSSDVISEIPEGFRAVTIRVDARTSVEGWARAGARVDVVWSSSVNGKPTISVIVENAKILSAERQIAQQQQQQQVENPEQPAPMPTTVTLLVQADDANRIQLASVSGSMSLSLRGLSDNKANKTIPLTTDDLFANGKSLDVAGQPRVMLSVRSKEGEKVGYTFADGELKAIQ
jgi:Flp pilus assembly protein CpaB